MNYYFSKKLEQTGFDEAITRVNELLENEGFGIATQVDMKATLKTKLDININKYQILGACNPTYAVKALKAEERIGTMLPCNVIVRQLNNGDIEITAVDPVASMMAVANPELIAVAKQIQQKLKKVIREL